MALLASILHNKLNLALAVHKIKCDIRQVDSQLCIVANERHCTCTSLCWWKQRLATSSLQNPCPPVWIYICLHLTLGLRLWSKPNNSRFPRGETRRLSQHARWWEQFWDWDISTMMNVTVSVPWEVFLLDADTRCRNKSLLKICTRFQELFSLAGNLNLTRKVFRLAGSDSDCNAGSEQARWQDARVQVCSSVRTDEWATRCSCPSCSYRSGCCRAFQRCRGTRCAALHWQYL